MNALVGVRLGMQDTSHTRRATAARQTTAQAAQTKSSVATKAATTNSTASTKSSSSTTDSSTTRTTGSELDKQAFLELLVTQLQNQDPLNPTDNSEMVAQLAQFSALEQMSNLNTSFEALSGDVDQLSFLSANSLIGKTVSGTDSSGATQSGTVSGVIMDSTNGISLVVGTTTLPISSITQIG